VGKLRKSLSRKNRGGKTNLQVQNAAVLRKTGISGEKGGDRAKTTVSSTATKNEEKNL